MVIKKVSQPLYRALGIFLSLFTINCAIPGFVLFVSMKGYSFAENIIFGLGAGAGFILALVITVRIREELDLVDVPKPFRGAPLKLIVAGILALAFMSFAGMIQYKFTVVSSRKNKFYLSF